MTTTVKSETTSDLLLEEWTGIGPRYGFFKDLSIDTTGEKYVRYVYKYDPDNKYITLTTVMSENHTKNKIPVEWEYGETIDTLKKFKISTINDAIMFLNQVYGERIEAVEDYYCNSLLNTDTPTLIDENTLYYPVIWSRKYIRPEWCIHRRFKDKCDKCMNV